MKGLSKTVEINGRDIEVRELTAGEIIDWERRLEEMIRGGSASATGNLLLEDFSLDDLAAMTGLPEAEILAMPPSCLEHLAAACKEVNPRFFVVRGVMMRPLKAALELMSLAGSPAG